MINYEEIINIINESKSNDEVVEAMYSFIKNPIAVTDNNYHLLSFFPHNKSIDTVFNDAVKNGYWPLEVVSIVNDVLDKNVPYQIITINNHRRLMFNIIFNQVHLGYCAILEQDQKLEDINIELCSIFVNFLARELYTIKPHQTKVSESQFLEDALIGAYLNRKVFLDKISTTSIKLGVEYKMALISLKTYKYKSYGDLDIIINNLFPNCIKSVKDDYLVILFLSKNNIDYKSSNEKFNELHISGVISSPIADLYFLNNKYDILNHLLTYLNSTNNHFKLFFENDYKDLLLLLEIKDENILTNAIKDEILTLDNYDKQNNSDLCNTLYAYLINNKSLLQASNELYLHKNTITYRLEKIKEIIQDDLENNKKNLSFINSLMILNYLKK